MVDLKMPPLSTSRFLKLFPAFRDAPAGLTRAVLKHSRRTVVPPDFRVQMEGDPCRDLAFTLSGEKRVYRVGESGREITLYDVGPGEICMINVSCVLSDRPCIADAMSITQVESLLLPAGVFRALVAEYEAMSKFAFDVVSDNITLIIELVNDIVFRRMDQRLREYLIEKSEDGNLKITHQRIASDLGTAREVISRLLKNMERDGAIRLARSRIHLLDLP